MTSAPRDSDSEALAAYLARIRRRLPTTAATVGGIAGQASALNEGRVDPEHFQREFSSMIRSLHVLGVTMDGATKDLAKRLVLGTDGRKLVEIRCTATLENLTVHLMPGAMEASQTELEQALGEAFGAMIIACRDLTLTTVESASGRAAAHQKKS
jgi:hypothetical protein